jgi:hypothetical protein
MCMSVSLLETTETLYIYIYVTELGRLNIIYQN